MPRTKTTKPRWPARNVRSEFVVNGDFVIGRMYFPSGPGPFPGVLISGPMTSVKEQVTGTYAEAMQERGFVALAIDHRHFGQSWGEPRQYEYYPDKIEDLHAAFDALEREPRVDKVYALGVCLGCGYIARTVIDRDDVCAFGAVAGYYRDVAAMQGKDFDDKVAAGKAAREKYETTGVLDTIPAVLPPGEGDAAMTMQSTYDYYGPGGRKAVPNYKNEFAVMSREYFLQFDVQPAAAQIKMPFMQLHGPNAIAPALAQKFFDNVASPKTKVELTSDGQTDIYDTPSIVDFAADNLASFFNANN